MDVEDLDSIELSPEDMALLEQDAGDIGASDADLEAELDRYAAAPAAGAARSRPVPAPDRATHHAAAYVGGSAAAYGGEEDEGVLAADASAAKRSTAMDVSDAGADDDELLAQLSAPSGIATSEAASGSSASAAQKSAPGAAASRATAAAPASTAATAAAAPKPATAAAASRPVAAAAAAGARGNPAAAPAAAPAIVLAPEAFELAKALGAQFAELKQRAQALAVSTAERSLLCTAELGSARCQVATASR